METNELPEEVKRKIDEWCESFKTGEWFENLRKEAMTEGYRLALQSKEEEIKWRQEHNERQAEIIKERNATIDSLTSENERLKEWATRLLEKYPTEDRL